MLTRKQHELLIYINRHLEQHGISPSFDEMKEALSLRSKSGIHRLITALEERGFIRRMAHRARALEVLRLPDAASAGHRGFRPSVVEGGFPGPVTSRPRESDGDIVSMPLYGRIAAGTPIEALRDPANSITVPGAMLATGEHFDESSLPTVLVPSEPDSPDRAYEKLETRERIHAAIASLPWRERKVIGLYYYGEVTMKQIGAEIGVNESRVSQLHARAIRRLREALGEVSPQQAAALRNALVTFARTKPAMAKAALPRKQDEPAAQAVVLRYKPAGRGRTPARATLKIARGRRSAVAAAR